MTSVYASDAGYDQQTHAVGGSRTSDWFWAAVFSAAVMAVALLTTEGMRSWIALPIFACGILTSVDAVAWLRGRMDLFDPVGIVGLISVHFFFLAPVLHITLNAWMAFVTPLTDWPDWLGWMAVINTMGLIIYRIVRSAACPQFLPVRTMVRRPSAILWPLMVAGLIISALVQLWVYWSFGGVAGYIYAFQHTMAAFAGWGWVFMISESFPLLLVMAVAAYYARRGAKPSWMTIWGVLLVFFVMKLFCGGLRGSRAEAVWCLFWAGGIIHFMVRRIPAVWVWTGTLLLLAFMYAWGFYKAKGLVGLEAALDPAARAQIGKSHGRTMEMVVLGDLARADVDAYLLRQTVSPQSQFKWAWGRTYLSTALLLIPKTVWPGRPDYIAQYGTNALFGEGYHGVASNVYGIGGEAIMNFGPLGGLLSFIPLGLVVGRLRGYMHRLAAGDLRWILMPFAVSVCVAVLVNDSDNVLFLMIKQGLVPFLVVYLGSALVAETASLPTGAASHGMESSIGWAHDQG